MPGEWVPIVMFSGLFLFLIARAYFRYKLHRTAVEKGQALPETPRGDLRKQSLVLIALGLGYSVAVHITLSYTPSGPEPLVASIWGIVPILIGAAMWLYWRMTEKERKMEDHGTPPLT